MADSVLVIRHLMRRYGSHPALWGIEVTAATRSMALNRQCSEFARKLTHAFPPQLLNEPGDLVEPPHEEEMRSNLRAYYHQAYATVREFSSDVVVIFCVLYWCACSTAGHVVRTWRAGLL